MIRGRLREEPPGKAKNDYAQAKKKFRSLPFPKKNHDDEPSSTGAKRRPDKEVDGPGSLPKSDRFPTLPKKTENDRERTRCEAVRK